MSKVAFHQTVHCLYTNAPEDVQFTIKLCLTICLLFPKIDQMSRSNRNILVYICKVL